MKIPPNVRQSEIMRKLYLLPLLFLIAIIFLIIMALIFGGG